MLKCDRKNRKMVKSNKGGKFGIKCCRSILMGQGMGDGKDIGKTLGLSRKPGHKLRVEVK